MAQEHTVLHRSLFLRGPAGRLEAQLWTTGEAGAQPFLHQDEHGKQKRAQRAAPLRGAMAALVCHPHPLYGGTLHNKVVFQAARSFHRLGLPVLRFNFRGAGLSEGQHDRGRGELEDVRAALDFLAGESPGRPVALAGFSFGAWVGLHVGAEDARVARLVGLGIPVNDSDFSYLRGCAKPKLFIVGTADQFAARARVQALVDSLTGPTALVFVEGGDHFFTGKLEQVDRAITEWMNSLAQ